MSERAPKPGDTAVRFDRSDLDAIGKARALAPTVKELAAGTGREVRVRPNPQTGRPETVATVPLREAIEAMRPKWRAEAVSSLEFDSKQSKETLVAKNGERRSVLASVARDVARATGSRGASKMRATSVYRDGRWWERRGTEWVEAPAKCLTRPLLEGDERTAPFGVVH